MNPVNNGLQYPLIGDRQRGFSRPIGRMNLSSTTRPIGRMGFATPPEPKMVQPRVKEGEPRRDLRKGFASSLPAHSSDWVRPEPTPPQIKQMLGKIGFISSLPASGTTWQGKGWA